MSSGMLLLAGLIATGPVAAPPEIVPVQPWETKQIEQKLAAEPGKPIPILPPVREGFPAPICEEPPTDQEVLRAMPRVPKGVPQVWETFRDDIVIVKNRLVDKIEAPRIFPLVGIAQLHHCRWECIVYFTETVQTQYPFPAKVQTKRTATVYTDKDFLHAVKDESTPKPQAKRELELRFDFSPRGVTFGAGVHAPKPPEYRVASGQGLRVAVPPVGPNPPPTTCPPPEMHAMMLQAFGQMGAPVAMPAPKPAPMPQACPPVMPASAAWTAPTLSPAHTIDLPEGTWFRTVGPVRYKLEVKAKTLVITTSLQDEDGTVDHILTIDWYPTRGEGEIVGLVKSFDVATNDKPVSRDEVEETLGSIADIQKQLAGKPVALTWRVHNGTLVVGDVRMPELKDQYKELSAAFAALGGNYKPLGSQALHVIPATFKTPKPVTGMTLPSGKYLQHQPQYFPDDPTFPLPRELQQTVPAAQEGKGGPTIMIWDPAVPKPALQFGRTYWPDDPNLRREFHQKRNPFRNGGDIIPSAGFDVPLQTEPPALPPMPPPEPWPGAKPNPFRNGGIIECPEPERIHGGIIRFVQTYSADPNIRMQQLLQQSEDTRQIGSEWRRFWFPDQPLPRPSR